MPPNTIYVPVTPKFMSLALTSPAAQTRKPRRLVPTSVRISTRISSFTPNKIPKSPPHLPTPAPHVCEGCRSIYPGPKSSTQGQLAPTGTSQWRYHKYVFGAHTAFRPATQATLSCLNQCDRLSAFPARGQRTLQRRQCSDTPAQNLPVPLQQRLKKTQLAQVGRCLAKLRN